MSTIIVKRQTPSSAMLEFRWRGGAYIDVFWGGGEVPDNVDVRYSGPGRGEDANAPFTTICVYDYSAGRPTIDDGDEDEVARHADEWIDENREDYGL